LINNAGSFYVDPTPEQIAEMVQANLLGLMLTTNALLPALIESRGVVINVLSVAALRDFPGSAAYGATKAGAQKYAQVLRAELAGKGVTVTNVYPGATDTPIWESIPFQPEDMMPAAEVAARIFELVGLADQDVVIE